MITAVVPVALTAVSIVAQVDWFPIDWDFWWHYLIQFVLLGTNITDGKGGLPTVAYTFFGTLVTFLITRGDHPVHPASS